MPSLNVQEAQDSLAGIGDRSLKHFELKRKAQDLAREFPPGFTLHQVLKSCQRGIDACHDEARPLHAAIRRAQSEYQYPAELCPCSGGGEVCLHADNLTLRCPWKECPYGNAG